MENNKEVFKEYDLDYRGKPRLQLVKIDVSGMIWDKKKSTVYQRLVKMYGRLPNGIRFERMTTRDKENCPDGLKLLVACDWIKRNRFYDDKGVFHFGSLINAIEKEKRGLTKKNIRA